MGWKGQETSIGYIPTQRDIRPVISHEEGQCLSEAKEVQRALPSALLRLHETIPERRTIPPFGYMQSLHTGQLKHCPLQIHQLPSIHTINTNLAEFIPAKAVFI